MGTFEFPLAFVPPKKLLLCLNAPTVNGAPTAIPDAFSSRKIRSTVNVREILVVVSVRIGIPLVESLRAVTVPTKASGSCFNSSIESGAFSAWAVGHSARIQRVLASASHELIGLCFFNVACGSLTNLNACSIKNANEHRGLPFNPPRCALHARSRMRRRVLPATVDFLPPPQAQSHEWSRLDS